MENLSEKLWNRKPGALTLARQTARFLKKSRKDYVGAHSLMLSTYQTGMGQSKFKKFIFFLPAFWHANWLYYDDNIANLDGNQLDILIKFYLDLTKECSVRKFGLDSNFVMSRLHNILTRLKDEQESYFYNYPGKPHQMALALLNQIEVGLITGKLNQQDADFIIKRVTALDYDIRGEEDEAYGLKQLIRIYKKLGIIYLQYFKNRSVSEHYLRYALEIAESQKPQVTDQVLKITAHLNEFGMLGQTK